MKKNYEVAVVGSGLIGQAWALVFARAGCQVRMWDGDVAALQRAKPRSALPKAPSIWNVRSAGNH